MQSWKGRKWTRNKRRNVQKGSWQQKTPKTSKVPGNGLLFVSPPKRNKKGRVRWCEMPHLTLKPFKSQTKQKIPPREKQKRRVKWCEVAERRKELDREENKYQMFRQKQKEKIARDTIREREREKEKKGTKKKERQRKSAPAKQNKTITTVIT